MYGINKQKVFLIFGHLILAQAREPTKNVKPTVTEISTNERKSEEKSKRGLDFSLGDHIGFEELGGHYGPSLDDLDAVSLGDHEHVSHGHIEAVTITKHVPVLQPYPVQFEKPVPYPVKVPVKVDRPYPIHVLQPYPVIHEKHIPYPVEKPVPYAVKVPVKIPVKVPYEVKIPIKVPIEVHKLVPYPVKVPVVVKEPYPVYIKEHHHHEHERFADFGHEFSHY